MNAFAGAPLAALWIVGLVVAAPLLRGGPRLADRARDAIVIGVAIPLVLGVLHLLYWPLCWVALVLCVAGSFAWRRNDRAFREPMPYLLFGMLALVAWPQLVQPALDGNTLAHHLPTAASWVHAHGIWTTQTRYWWYPPASELFASALYAVSTPFALGYAGFVALALLSLRIYAWAREGAHLPTRYADAFAAAVCAIAPLALQAGSLQNDVWLAAFVVEILWSAPVDDVTVLRSAALCALLKPDGWIYAAIALAASGAKPRAWAIAIAAAFAWVVRDTLLWHSAFVPAGTLGLAHLWRSTMLAHPEASLALGFAAAAKYAPLAVLLLLAALASPRLARDSPLASAGIACVIVALVMPFGFADASAHLAGTSALRYFAPAIVVGALVLAPHLRALPHWSLWIVLGAAIVEGLGVLSIFWNDRAALVALVAALAVPLGIAALRRTQTRWTFAIAAGALVVITTVLASRTPVRFVSDALAVRGQRSGVYAWIARAHPPRIAGWGLQTGAIALLSPRTTIADVPDADPCGHAQRIKATLIALAEPGHTSRFNRSRIHEAALCGRVLYRDPLAIAVDPL
ncbi:MAG: hypothetical protein ACREMP_01790 [Candidatus Tyrphobacter sp.]